MRSRQIFSLNQLIQGLGIAIYICVIFISPAKKQMLYINLTQKHENQ